jgi:glutamine synthetase
MKAIGMDFSINWTDTQRAKVAKISLLIQSGEIETVRFAFADQHGLVRGKTVMANQALDLLKNGLNVVGTLLLKDTSHHTAYSVFTQNAGMEQDQDGSNFAGASDVTLMADPDTFRLLPWVEKTGWVLCNAVIKQSDHSFKPAPFCTRSLYQRALGVLQAKGFHMVAGLEVEFYLFRADQAPIELTEAGWPGEPPKVHLLNTGYQLLTEQRIDQLHEPIDILRKHMQQLGLPLTSMEIELGPSQVEFVFGPQVGIAPADAMILFRSATKQIMRRHGYHASFMCRPQIPHVMSSGWHLHQSLRHVESGLSAFAAPNEQTDHPLSDVGMHYLAGLLEHAGASTVFSTPTINGYRRYMPNSLAPSRVGWGVDHRGTMLRVIGSGQAARIENRVGEPAANPYLYMASQVFAGLDGMARKLSPAAPIGHSDNAYITGQSLPTSLSQALQALESNDYFRLAFGPSFVNYYTHLKRFELARFEAEVTAWEQREYFDLF